MFIEPRKAVSVDELLRGMIVQSATTFDRAGGARRGAAKKRSSRR